MQHFFCIFCPKYQGETSPENKNWFDPHHENQHNAFLIQILQKTTNDKGCTPYTLQKNTTN